MKKDFNDFINTLTTNIMYYDDLVDVEKVINSYSTWYQGFADINKKLSDYEEFYNSLDYWLTNNPQAKEYIPLLFATRNKQGKMIKKNGEVLSFTSTTPNQEVIEVIKNSPLDKLVAKKMITNVNDYLLGVEVGLDSNARKNRTGTMMEKLVIDIISRKGVEVKPQYHLEQLIKDGLLNENELEEIKSLQANQATKVFDFMFQFEGKVYLCETNFYNSGGSKLNEVAKSYLLLNERLSKILNLEFIWVTDGFGWKTAKNQIHEAYTKIPFLFNIHKLENNSLRELLN